MRSYFFKLSPLPGAFLILPNYSRNTAKLVKGPIFVNPFFPSSRFNLSSIQNKDHWPFVKPTPLAFSSFLKHSRSRISRDA